MSVYKTERSPFYHYDFRLRGRRFHGSTGQTERRAAERFEEARRAEAARELERAATVERQFAGDDALTIDAAVGRYWNEVAQFRAAPDTEWTNLARLVAHFGAETALQAITDSDVAAFVAKRRGERVKGRRKASLVAPATVNRTTVDVLRKLFVHAAKAWGIRFERVPNWGAHRLKERGEVVRELRPSEDGRILEALPVGYRDLYAFALASGLRLAECFLRWSQVDEENGRIDVVQKGGRPHAIPISREIRAILEAQRGRDKEWVFVYETRRPRKSEQRRRGELRPVTYNGMKTAWRRARAKLGLADIRFHDLRHTRASTLVRATGNLKLAQRLLGHADISTTARYYVHVMMDDLADALDADFGRRNSRKKSRSADPAKEKHMQRQGRKAE